MLLLLLVERVVTCQISDTDLKHSSLMIVNNRKLSHSNIRIALFNTKDILLRT